MENSFQKWASDYASAFGFTVSLLGNWVVLHKDGRAVECMSVQGVQQACKESNK